MFPHKNAHSRPGRPSQFQACRLHEQWNSAWCKIAGRMANMQLDAVIVTSLREKAKAARMGPTTFAPMWSEPLRVDNELSEINSWREAHEKDEAALRPSIQDISSS